MKTLDEAYKAAIKELLELYLTIHTTNDYVAVITNYAGNYAYSIYLDSQIKELYKFIDIRHLEAILKTSLLIDNTVNTDLTELIMNSGTYDDFRTYILKTNCKDIKSFILEKTNWLMINNDKVLHKYIEDKTNEIFKNQQLTKQYAYLCYNQKEEECAKIDKMILELQNLKDKLKN